jgi:hypothetical protein
MTYVPMTNDRRDFDPMGKEWSYIPDEHPGQPWRGMIPVNLRPATWPYKLHTDRLGKDPYGSVRLVPDWCCYAWGNEIAGATWSPAAEHTVNCRTTIERRYAPPGQVSDWPANPFAGEGNDRWRVYDWTARIDLNLLDRSFALTVRGRGEESARPPHVPADVYAEAQHKAGKLLAFFRAECEHWKAGDQERPVQARDLYDAQKAAQS